MADQLTKETFVDLVTDAGGYREFMYAMYKKLTDISQAYQALSEVVQGLGTNQVNRLVPEDNPTPLLSDENGTFVEYEGEQMLGDASMYGWHLLHERCPSRRTVRYYQRKLVADVVRAGIFKASPELIRNSIESAIHRNTTFRSYRKWVWEQSGDPHSKPAVAGLDPWSYLPGLKELAGPADNPAYANRFVEINMGAIGE